VTFVFFFYTSCGGVQNQAEFMIPYIELSRPERTERSTEVPFLGFCAWIRDVMGERGENVDGFLFWKSIVMPCGFCRLGRCRAHFLAVHLHLEWLFSVVSEASLLMKNIVSED
jgi:hypothetical protein